MSTVTGADPDMVKILSEKLEFTFDFVLETLAPRRVLMFEGMTDELTCQCQKISRIRKGGRNSKQKIYEHSSSQVVYTSKDEEEEGEAFSISGRNLSVKTHSRKETVDDEENVF